jgi:hypothetical protein
MPAPVAPSSHDSRLARMLILDELFDLSLYQAIRELINPARSLCWTS